MEIKKALINSIALVLLVASVIVGAYTFITGWRYTLSGDSNLFGWLFIWAGVATVITTLYLYSQFNKRRRIMPGKPLRSGSPAPVKAIGKLDSYDYEFFLISSLIVLVFTFAPFYFNYGGMALIFIVPVFWFCLFLSCFTLICYPFYRKKMTPVSITAFLVGIAMLVWFVVESLAVY
jgi:hypothetical protein